MLNSLSFITCLTIVRSKEAQTSSRPGVYLPGISQAAAKSVQYNAQGCAKPTGPTHGSGTKALLEPSEETQKKMLNGKS